MSHSSTYFAVLRHSVRADMNDDVENPESDVWSLAWPDKEGRPWDPPILDFDLPRTVAAKSNLSKPVIIYTSPFRRCLQTAAVVANSLGVEEITVHNGLGEVMQRARSCCDESHLAKLGNNKNYLLPSEELARTVGQASRGLVRVRNTPQHAVAAEPPNWTETYPESLARLERSMEDLRHKHKQKNESVLIVSHGDALQAAANVFSRPCPPTIYDLRFCALVKFDQEENLAFHYGLQLLQEE